MHGPHVQVPNATLAKSFLTQTHFYITIYKKKNLQQFYFLLFNYVKINLLQNINKQTKNHFIFKVIDFFKNKKSDQACEYIMQGILL